MANLRRSRGIVATRGGAPRLTEWIRSADQNYVVIGNNTSVITQSFAINVRQTIVRVRGELSIIPTATSVDVKSVGAMGFAVVTDQAVAAGAASIPGPITNADWDGWFVWVPFHQFFEVTTDIGRLLAQTNVIFDSKAMRKVKLGDTIVVMVESQVGAFSAAATFRMLTKLA